MRIAHRWWAHPEKYSIRAESQVRRRASSLFSCFEVHDESRFDGHSRLQVYAVCATVGRMRSEVFPIHFIGRRDVADDILKIEACRGNPGFLRPGCGQNFIELAENLTQLGLYAALDRMASAARNSRDD